MQSCQSRRLAGAKSRVVQVLAAAAVAALAAGCASNEAPSRVAGPPPPMVAPGAQAHAADGPRSEARSMRIDVEDDGLPSQLAPRNRPSGPDDPTEPWSPNYGKAAPARAAAATPEPAMDTARLKEKLATSRPAPHASAAAAPVAAVATPRVAASAPAASVPERAPVAATPTTPARATSAQTLAVREPMPAAFMGRDEPSSPRSEDELIRQAIAAHEMRRNR